MTGTLDSLQAGAEERARYLLRMEPPPASGAQPAIDGIRAVVAEAWQGGRDEAGRELAGVLRELVGAGRLRWDALLPALGSLLPDSSVLYPESVPSPPDGTAPGALAGAGLFIHVRNDSASGRLVETAQRMMRWWHDHGYAVGSVPADGLDHPYGRPCPHCSTAPVPACDHGQPGLRYVVSGLCRQCGEDVFRGCGSMASMRVILSGRHVSFTPHSSRAELAALLDASKPAEAARAQLPDHRRQP